MEEEVAMQREDVSLEETLPPVENGNAGEACIEGEEIVNGEAEEEPLIELNSEEINTAKRKRAPILWAGEKKVEGDGVDIDEAKMASPKRLRPNPKFLHGYLNGLEQTNKRLLAETASNAACKEITAVASAGAKAQFDRIPVEEAGKFRKTALMVAKHQNFACCIAVLKEVAAHYGFALNVETEEARAEGILQNNTPQKLTEEYSESEEEEELEPRLMVPLYARLRSDMDDPDSLDHRKRPALPPEPDPPKPTPPVLVSNNRLANSAIAAITGQPSGAPRKPTALKAVTREGSKPSRAVLRPTVAKEADEAIGAVPINSSEKAVLRLGIFSPGAVPQDSGSGLSPKTGPLPSSLTSSRASRGAALNASDQRLAERGSNASAPSGSVSSHERGAATSDSEDISSGGISSHSPRAPVRRLAMDSHQPGASAPETRREPSGDLLKNDTNQDWKGDGHKETSPVRQLRGAVKPTVLQTRDHQYKSRLFSSKPLPDDDSSDSGADEPVLPVEEERYQAADESPPCARQSAEKAAKPPKSSKQSRNRLFGAAVNGIRH